MSGIKEVLPMAGLLFQEQSLNPVLCKPKLMPLKSVTLERLERMQKEAQEKMWEIEKELVKASSDAVSADSNFFASISCRYTFDTRTRKEKGKCSLVEM